MKHNYPNKMKSTALRQQGAVLLETLIAIVIFSFGILAISGLQAAMMKNTADATYRAEASYLIQQRMGQIMVDPIGLGTVTNEPIATLPNGRLNISRLSNQRLLLRITWQVPGEDMHTYDAITSMFLARSPA